MAFGTSELLRMWSFERAPPEFRILFPDGGGDDWLVCVPLAQRELLEPTLLRWQAAYPVKSKELPGPFVVYWGSPRLAFRWIAKKYQSIAGQAPNDVERRAAARITLYCPSRYETHSEPRQAGTGHTIDMSSSGIAFTTESMLPAEANVTLLVRWPVLLEGDVPIELHAAGRLTRTEDRKAALQLESMSFSIAV